MYTNTWYTTFVLMTLWYITFILVISYTLMSSTTFVLMTLS